MRYFCAMHDMIGNCKPKDFDRMTDGEMDCVCCKRPIDTIKGHGFELPKPEVINGMVMTVGKQEYCNCFITGEDGKNYTEDEIRAHHHNRDITIEDIESAKIELQELELQEELDEKAIALP